MRIIYFLLWILILSLSLYAGERNVTLTECIDTALQNHPNFFLSIEDQKKSAAQYRVAKSMKSVIVNGEIKTVEYEKEDSTANSNFQVPGKDTNIGLFAGLTIIYNLYDARKDYIEEQAKNSIDISKLKRQKTSNEIILNVKTAYYGYLLAKSNLDIMKEIFEKSGKKAKLARQLFEQGSRPILDVSKAEVDMADSQLKFEKAKNEERKSRLNLLHSMGVEENENITLIPVDIESIPEVKCTLDDLYRMSEVYNPQLRIIMLEKRSAKIKIDEEHAAHYPKIDLLLGLGYQNKNLYGMENANRNFDVGNWSPAFNGAVVASLPVYSGGRVSANVDSAKSDYNSITFREKEFLVQMKNQIRDNFKSLDEIKRQIEISELIIKNAQRHLLLAQKSYENGGGSPLELQDAELSVIRAEIGYHEARYGYLLTLAKLTSIVGIGETTICKSPD